MINQDNSARNPLECTGISVLLRNNKQPSAIICFHENLCSSQYTCANDKSYFHTFLWMGSIQALHLHSWNGTDTESGAAIPACHTTQIVYKSLQLSCSPQKLYEFKLIFRIQKFSICFWKLLLEINLSIIFYGKYFSFCFLKSLLFSLLIA